MGESKRGIEGGGYESGRVGAINTITLSGLHANYKDDQRPELIVMSLAFRNMDLMSILPNLPSMICLLYTSPSPRDRTRSRMPSSA